MLTHLLRPHVLPFINHLSLSYLGPYAKRKREGEDVTIVVAGCVAQQEGQTLLRRAPEVDLVMGPQFANRLSDLLEEMRLERWFDTSSFSSLLICIRIRQLKMTWSA